MHPTHTAASPVHGDHQAPDDAVESKGGHGQPPSGQDHGPITYANQATYRMTYRLEHSPYFAIATLGKCHFVPAICTFATARFNCCELSNPVIEGNPLKQALFLLIT